MKDENQKKFDLRSLLKPVEAQIAIKTAIVAALGWFIGSWFSHITKRPDSLISGLWCTLTAIVVLQTHLGGTYKASWIRFSGVILGSTVGALCTSLLGANPLTLGVSIFFIVMLCFLLNIKDSIRISCLSVSVVMVLWGLNHTISPWSFAFFRALDSLLGILIAVFVAHSLWPFQATEKLCANMSQILGCIRRLLCLSFFTEHTTQNSEEEYEKIKSNLNDLIQEDILILDETKIELWSDPQRLDKYIFLHERLQHMRRLIINLGKVYGYVKTIIEPDPELTHQLMSVMNLLDQSLHDLAQALLYDQPAKPFLELSTAHEKLTQELLHFRSLRITRKFDLPEVEGFYVFFYNLNNFLKVFLKIADSLKES